MGLFKRRKNSRTAGGAAVSDRDSTRSDLAQLREFSESRNGVEAYVEPRTSVTQTTMLLIAADGEWTRRRIESPEAAQTLAKKLQIPCYDTNRVGIPQRMREYNMRKAGKGSSSSNRRTDSNPSMPAPNAVDEALTPAKSAALMMLESIAGSDPLDDNPDQQAIETVWKRARARAHPDRRGGDRSAWDKVEQSARILGLDDPGRGV